MEWIGTVFGDCKLPIWGLPVAIPGMPVLYSLRHRIVFVVVVLTNIFDVTTITVTHCCIVMTIHSITVVASYNNHNIGHNDLKTPSRQSPLGILFLLLFSSS